MKLALQKRELKSSAREAVTGYLFFLLWIIGFSVFTLYPMIYSIRLSFNSLLLSPGKIQMDYKGLYYYKYIWNVDTQFRTNLSGSMLTILCFTPMILVFSLIISLLLNKKIPGKTFFRVLFFFPVIIMSGPAISNLLSRHSLDFSKDSPMLFEFIRMLPEFIQTPTLFILNNIVMVLWMSGVQILIFLAGLQKISPDLYEAADIDGAGGWEKFWKITFPFMGPMIFLNAVYTVIDVASMSNNAVNKQIASELLSTKGIYSFSAAMSWLYFLCVAAVLAVIVLAALFVSGGKKKNG